MPETWTLLIIDDCAADRKIYRRYLAKDPYSCYRVFEADSVEEGLDLCLKIRPNVILLDFCLPDESGLEFLQQLKHKTIETVIPVIMLTGHGDEEIAVRAMKSGVQDYLVKQHLKPDVLQLAVRNAIKQLCLQKQLNKTLERQRLIATTALSIRESLDLEKILHTTVVEIQKILNCDRVVVYQFMTQVAKKDPIPASEFETGDWDLSKQYLKECSRGISRTYTSGLCNCSLEPQDLLSNKTNLVVPIHLNHNGHQAPELWGLLIAHHSSLLTTTEEEMDILNQVSVQLAIAIQQAELLKQTQIALEKENVLNNFKSQIIATVSHEYRTPLASILASASTLKQNSDRLDQSKQQKFLEMIEQKARHLSKLVDDMLVVNQFELDKTKFKPMPLDLLLFFSSLMEEQQEMISDRHSLTFQITGNNKGFWGDRGLLRLIFTNLISNAIKYSPNGGTVKFHLTGKEDRISFYVQDKGIGVPISDQDNLFQPFHRGSNVDTIPGIGLGLAIAKSCVDLHGGDIALTSKLGKGTKVTVTLPKRNNM